MFYFILPVWSADEVNIAAATLDGYLINTIL